MSDNFILMEERREIKTMQELERLNEFLLNIDERLFTKIGEYTQWHKIGGLGAFSYPSSYHC